MKPRRVQAPNERLLRRLSRACSIAAGLIGLAVFVLWIATLVRGSFQPTTHPLAALLFIVSAVGFFRSSKGEGHGFLNEDRLSRWCAIVLLITGAAKTIEVLSGSGPYVDQWLFPSNLPPGNELATNSTLNFLLCGAALLFLDAQARGGFRPAQPLLVLAAMIALLALVGYSYKVIAFYKLGAGAPMSLMTAVGFLLLTAAGLMARPHHGIMSLINSPTLGGAMARRLLPVAILVPWVLGVLRWAGECRGWYTTQFGIAIFTVTTILVFALLVWWTAKLLHKADIKRRKAEERLRKATANLERSNSDLQQFAYVASHDLFEPLRMITSYLQLIEQMYKDRLDDRGREFISHAVDGARRMRALISDLLAYSRLETKELAFQTVDCTMAAEAAIANLKVAIEETEAQIHLEPLPKVKGDLVQLTQLFQNLVGNGIKFKGPRTPEIHIEASRQEKDWLFSVSDNGIGISQEYFERIFVIFQRLHTRTEYPGTGIGLAVCKKIVERHGGRIWVESTPGEGSTFRFTLPAKDS